MDERQKKNSAPDGATGYILGGGKQARMDQLWTYSWTYRVDRRSSLRGDMRMLGPEMVPEV